MIERETVFSQRIQLIRSSGIRKLFDLAQTMSGVISLGIGEPDFDTPQHIREAAKRALDAGYTRYTPNAGFPDLREALSAKVAKVNGKVELHVVTSISILCKGLDRSLNELCIAAVELINTEFAKRMQEST